ncbi:MAG: chemotaxis protein CheX [Bdellovibrionales bacterium]|nr:chemotaxis protein CheX [Bdellovibrionales bacterium]
MPQKIGIVTRNLSFFNLLNRERRSDQNYEMELVKSIDALKDLSNKGKIMASFIFDGTHEKDEIVEFGKFIKSSKRFESALLFLAFNNFETFQAITTDENFSNAKIINMPAPGAEIYAKLIADTAQIANKANIKSKAEGTISSASFLNIFIESTIATIKEMTSCADITFSAPSLLDYQKMEHEIAIRGKLAITSPHFTGSFFISFPKSTYLKFCTKVYLEEVTEINKDNEDLVSELCNIVYGKSKVLVSKLDMKLGMVIPTFNCEGKIKTDSKVLLVKLSTEMGDFYVKVAPGLT